MRFRISVTADVDFTEMLSPENISGAMMALGAKSEVDVVKKFAENILTNTQIYTSDFANVEKVSGGVTQIKEDSQVQAQAQVQAHEQNVQNNEPNDGGEPAITQEEQRALVERLQQIALPPQADSSSDATPFEENGDEVEAVEAVEAVEDVEVVEETNYSDMSTEYQEEPHAKLARNLFNINAMGFQIESVIVNNQELKDYLLNRQSADFNENNVVVREDLGQDFIIRHVGEGNNIIEVGE